MNNQIEEMAQTLAEASRFAGKILVEETRAFVEEYHKYHSQNDFDKCHSKTVHELEAEYLHAKGYRKASDVAAKIFDEIVISIASIIPNEILLINKERGFSDGVMFGKREALFGALNAIAELKKKYESEGKR